MDVKDCAICIHYHLWRQKTSDAPVFTEEFCDAFGGWPEPDHCCYFKRRKEASV